MADFVTTNINSGVPPLDGSRAWQKINANSMTGVRERNWTVKGQEAEVENLRGKEDSVSLDTAGFQFYVRPSEFVDFDNDEKIKTEYYSESEKIIKELTGASRVVFFDHSA